MRLTDQQLAEIAARAKRVVDQGIVDDMGDPIAHARTDVPALLAELRREREENEALRAQRAALAGVLAAVETPAHNAAVLRSGVNMLDYTHGMESLNPAPAVEAR